MLFAGADGFFECVVIGATIGRVKFLGFEYNVAFPTNASDNAVNLICHNSFCFWSPEPAGSVGLHPQPGYKDRYYFLITKNISIIF